MGSSKVGGVACHQAEAVTEGGGSDEAITGWDHDTGELCGGSEFSPDLAVSRSMERTRPAGKRCFSELT